MPSGSDGHDTWPLKTIVRDEITFGVPGNARAFQAHGWSDPEASFTWTSGDESALILSTPDAPR